MRQFCDGVNNEELGSELTNAERHPQRPWAPRRSQVIMLPVVHSSGLCHHQTVALRKSGTRRILDPMNPVLSGTVAMLFWHEKD